MKKNEHIAAPVIRNCSHSLSDLFIPQIDLNRKYFFGNTPLGIIKNHQGSTTI